MLIKEKSPPGRRILNEFKLDCWLTFTRESAINGDPSARLSGAGCRDLAFGFPHPP